MNAKIIFSKIHYYLSLFLALMLPIWPRLVPFIVTALTVNWIFSGSVVQLFKKDNSSKYLLLFVSLYIFYLLGLLYSVNRPNGGSEIMTKLSLGVCPLIFFSFGKFAENQFKLILKTFVYGCVIIALICFAQSTYNYVITKYSIAHGGKDWDFGINWFLKDRFSIWMHQSYRAMYFVLALVFMYYPSNDLISSKGIRYCIAFLFAVSILLFDSKAGFISLLLFGIYISWRMIVKEKKLKVVLLGMSVMLFIFSLLFFLAPQFKLRIKDAFIAVSGNVDVKKSDESTATRMAIWGASGKVISENILCGVGTGSAENYLLKEYDKEGMITASTEKLNAHNQFLQTFIDLGIGGFLLLLAIIFIPLVHAWRRKKFLYVFFLLLFVINILVESMLEAQAGVIYYAFMNSLLCVSLLNNNDE